MASFSTPLDLQVNINNLLLVEEDIHWEFDGDYNIYNALWTFVKVTFINIESTSISIFVENILFLFLFLCLFCVEWSKIDYP
jgi:hypothetical protein